MIIFYTTLYLAIGLFIAKSELLMLEDRAKNESDFLVKIGYFIDWSAMLILSPVVASIRESYKKGLTSSVNILSTIFNILKEILVFVPKILLFFAIEVRKIFRS